MKAVDMHCDTLSVLRGQQKEKPEVGLLQNEFHVDLRKLQEGGYLLQNFAMFVDLKKEEDLWKAIEQMTALFYRELEKNRERIAPVRDWSDIEKNRVDGKLSALLCVEEGGVCGGDVRRLEQLYEMGVRMLTLTWNYPNELGYPNFIWEENGELPDFKKPNTEQGLTETGRIFVEEMERLGIIPDVSHLSDAGFYDVLETAKKPFVASHSNARTLCPWVRNLTDDMIRRLAEHGGVIGLNFCADFLSEGKPGESNPGTIQAVVEHARHITNIGGVECLGLGSDFDGIETHAELPDASYLPCLEEAFHKNGFAWSDIDKIMGSNVLRIYRDCLSR